MSDRVYSVSEITAYVKSLIQTDLLLQELWVSGEISNSTRSAAGHYYFTLKDAGATLSCVLWRGVAAYQTTLPANGQAVEVRGGFSLYEPRGQYQLVAQEIRPAGIGRLYQEFEALKARLSAEGLFAEERKRPLPSRPRRIGLVTSPTGAALQDILRVLRYRYPVVDVILSPTLVQGAEAPLQIVAAIRALNEWPQPVDTLIVARGGGSLEELWAFNDERVARAIVASRIPVISGVGHETDFTIADFAADYRAPTPTGAAMAAVPDARELRAQLRDWAATVETWMRTRVTQRRTDVLAEVRALQRVSPKERIARIRQQTDDLTRAAASTLQHRLTLWRERVAARRAQLSSLSPLAVLARGYAVVQREDTGAVVRRTAEVATGDTIRVRVTDGDFRATVSADGKAATPGSPGSLCPPAP
ncbi:MAG: exodeoxyribonuclease VII large subunit [Anaerolineae bacterium]|nr:exodeoxyribonuclease VII large subunit [Anaerolineae bacterium]